MSTGINYKTLREEVVILIRKRILNREIKPGERIKELELSKELNISRGPVREALRQIEQEGLVEYSPNRGCTVKTISPSTMREIYLLRSTLEILAVKIYLGNMKPSSIEKLKELVNKMERLAEENELSGIVEVDEEFHATIVREANAKLLYDTWKTFEGGNAAVYYTMQSSNLMPRKHLKANHYMIIEAFEERNMDKIVEIIQNHYMVVPEDLSKNIKKESEKILSV